MFATVLYSLVLFSFVLSNPIELKNTLYIITNAERPSFDRPGLRPVGLQRASECIPSVFANLNVTFGVILVCTPETGDLGCMAASTTAAALAAQSGLILDTSCGTGDDSDDDCVPNLLVEYTKKLDSTQSMLIVWDANDMDDLLENLQFELPGDDDNDNDDDEVTSDDLPLHADIILVKDVSEYTTLAVTSMNCTGIDGDALGPF